MNDGNSDPRERSAAAALERPRELEDWLNYRLYHPLSMYLARMLAPTPVTPNMVSVAGGTMIVLAALVYLNASSLVGVILALALHMSWHVLDGADGDLARLTGRTSTNGEIVDGICDYAGHIVLYVVLGALLAEQIGGAAWWLMWAAGLARIVQAAHYEVERRQYRSWVYGTPWLRISKRRDGGPQGVLGALAAYYLWLATLVAPNPAKVDLAVANASPADRSSMRSVIRRAMAPVLKWTGPLSANYRTIVLGASMLAGSPLYFFVFEAFVLSVWMLASMVVSRRAHRRILDQFATSSSR